MTLQQPPRSPLHQATHRGSTTLQQPPRSPLPQSSNPAATAAPSSPAPDGGCPLPHHTLIGYQVALELVRVVARVRIGEPQLRAQARKAATSAALNCAEGAARESAGDKRRVYAIAVGEACEAAAAVEIAGALGVCAGGDVSAVVGLVRRFRRVMWPLVR